MGGIRFEPDGDVTIITGTLDYGQGHASPFAQVLSDRLGIPFDRIKLLQGDSDELIAGGGTGGSRSMMQSGGAIVAASDLVIERGKQLAAHVLEAAAGDIEFLARTSSPSPAPIAASGSWNWRPRCARVTDLPDDLPRDAGREPHLQGRALGVSQWLPYRRSRTRSGDRYRRDRRYSTVNDFGVLVNPMLVEGQAHGGIAQGIGQALTEMRGL